MSRHEQLKAGLQQVRQAIDALRLQPVRQCREECENIIKLIYIEYECGLDVLNLLTSSQTNGGSDTSCSSLDDFEQSVDTLYNVANDALPTFQKCCGTGFWRLIDSPRRELQAFAEKLCCTPLDPVKAASEIPHPPTSRRPHQFANPATAQLIAIPHSRGPPTLWISNHCDLECHQPVQKANQLNCREFAWKEGQAVTASAVSLATGCVWTGHQNGGIVIHPCCGKRKDPTPIEDLNGTVGAITAIALDESRDACDAWVADANGKLLVLKCEPAPGDPPDYASGSLHLVGSAVLPAPATALFVLKCRVLLATGGQAPMLRLIEISASGSGHLRHMNECHHEPVQEPIKHIVLLKSEKLDSFHIITASDQPAAHGLTIWHIKHHTFQAAAHVCPPPLLPGPPPPLPSVCGLHISKDHSLLVTVHNHDTALRTWDLDSIQQHVRRPPLRPDHPCAPIPTPTLQPPMACITIKTRDRDQVVASCADQERLIVAHGSGVVRSWDFMWLRCYTVVHSGLKASTGNGLLSSLASVSQPEPAPSAGAEESEGEAEEGALGGGVRRSVPAGPGTDGAPGSVAPLITMDELEILSPGVPLGEGSFGQVYLARFRGDYVAVKFLRQQESSCTREQVEGLVRTQTRHLEREVQHLSRVVYCPRFVRVVGYCLEPPCIVTEYYEKGSLANQLCVVRDAIRKQKLPSTQVVQWDVRLRIARGVAAGMETAHKLGLIHGDLRSANIMLDSSHKPYIGDLGQAVLLNADWKHHTTHFRWAAPELLEGEKPTEKTDVWAMGVVLRELLTCDTLPYRGQTDFMVIMGKAEPLKVPLEEELPLGGSQYMEYYGLEAYEDLMTACLQRNPADRPEFSRICKELTGIIVQPKFKRVANVLLSYAIARKTLNLWLRPELSTTTSVATAGPSTPAMPSPFYSTSELSAKPSDGPTMSPPSSSSPRPSLNPGHNPAPPSPSSTL